MPTLTFDPLTPPSVTIGQTMPPIKIMSSLGTANVPITVSIRGQDTSGTPLLGGTVTEPTDATGTATFSDLFVYGGTSKNVTMIAQAGAGVASSLSTFQVRPGGDHLYIATQVPTTVAAAALPDLTVQVLDVNGTIDRTDGAPGGPPGDTLQLYIDHNPGGAQFVDSNGMPLAGPIKAVVKEGVATFSGVRLKVAGVGYTLGVQALNNDLLTNGTSNAFAITAAAPKALAFQVQPGYSDQFTALGAYNTRAYGSWPGVWALDPVVPTITAGTFITDQLGNALQVKVIDANGNTVKTDNSTVVSIGVLRNEGRGPHFLGQGTDPTSVVYAPNPNATMSSYATATVKNGVATFGGAQDVYEPVVGNNYILSAGTDSFATTVAGSTNGFNVVPGPVTKLAFINQPLDTGAGLALSVGSPQAFPGQPGLAVAAEDAVNNIVPTFTGSVQVSLVPVNNAPGTLTGTTTVNAFRGVALFNTLTVRQTQAQSPQNYSLKAAGADANSNPISVTSSQFTVNGPLNLTFNGQAVNPQLKFLTAPSQVQSGTSFGYQLQVFDANNVPGLPANFFADGGQAPAHVTILLRDSSGNLLPAGPFLVGDGDRNTVGNNGLITFNEAIAVPATTTFQMYALLDLGGLAITSTTTPPAPTFQVTVASDPPPQGIQSAGPNASPSIVQEGLGSVTTNFDTITNFPVNQATPVGQQPYPPVTSFDPATVTGPPAQQQPNVAAGFNQVPQTSKWWSSLIFPRNAGGFGLPTDSQNNELWPLYAGPLAALVNSNSAKTTDPNQFAGLGMAYLTNLIVTQTTPFTENPTSIPPGQPLSLQNPQYPGAAGFNYN
ncbi:MAG TPA: hypothetical protein VFE78_07725 [Gemmataceae bacterium]|nr:hypothetical protein [Gemmataceae bacterium]